MAVIKKLICAVTAAVLMLTGCQMSKEEPVQPEDVALYPMTINGISFSEAPQRVVSLCPQLTSLLSAQGHADAVVGVSVDQAAEGQRVVGSADSPDVDAILALKPDLVLTQQAIPAKQINQLKEAGTTTLVLPVPQNFYQIEAQYQELFCLFDGSVPAAFKDLGIEAGDSRAQEVFASYEQQLKEMAKRAASGEAVSFVFVLSPDGSKVATGKTAEGNLIGLIGCNVAQNASGYQISFEEIAQQAPDYVFVPKGESIAIVQNQEYQQLDAVANGRIVEIDLGLLNSQDPEKVVELCKTVCEHLYGNSGSK